MGALSVLATACADGSAPADVPAAGVQAPAPVLDGELEQLVSQHRERADAQPDNARARGRLGLVYEANHLWPQARESFARAAALDRSDPIWPLHEAIAALELGDVEGALGVLRSAFAAHPDCAPLAARLGDVELEQGNFEAAQRAYRSAADSEPRAAEPLLGLGEVALAADRPQEAIELLERAVASDPAYKPARYVLGLAYRAAGRLEEADRELSLGSGGRKRGMADRGSAQLVELSAGDGRGLGTSRALLQKGRYREATQLLEPLVERFPENARLRVNLGLALYYGGRRADGLRHVEEAEALDTTYAMTPFNLAGLYLAEGRAADARDASVRALSIDPSFAPAHGLLGRALFELGLDAEAEEALTEALRLGPTDPRPHLTLGELLHRRGQLEEARGSLTRAVELAPQDPQPWLALFALELGRADLDAADRALARLQSLAPQDPRTLESQASLVAARGAAR